MDEYYNQVVAICKERNVYQLLSTDMKTGKTTSKYGCGLVSSRLETRVCLFMYKFWVV
jgi:hypothetical protein